eukprot:COSAG01_NODE_9260_length_2500_cov_10.617545_1_plen_289_part_00
MALRDFVAGSLAGAASVIVGQPFDTVKVRAQSQPAGARFSSTQVLVDTVRGEGVRGLFKGTLAPVAAVSFINAVAFSSKGAALRLLQPGSATSATPPPLWAVFLSGNCAGIAASVPGTPMELVKCRLQVQRTGQALYDGNIDCVRQIVARDGPLGLWRGYTIMTMRESLAFGVYFSTYDGVKEQLSVAFGSCNAGVQMAAGAVSGAATWSAVCPLDVIKTRIQTTGSDSHCHGAATITAVTRQLLSESNGGVRQFYTGIGPAVMRGVPSNAVVFVVYETIISRWSSDN